jgi:HEAT repeat protein
MSGCGRGTPEAREAEALLRQGEYESAAAAIERGLQRHPRDATLWRLSIRAAMGRDAAAAVATYERWHQVAGAHDRVALRRMALTTLWQALRVPSADVQMRAIQAVERHEVEALANDVAARVADETDVVAAAAAVALLRSDPGAPAVAAQLLRSDVPRARAIVVEGMGRKLVEAPVRALALRDLRPLLGDPAAEVRAAAALAVARMGDAAAREQMLALAQGDPAAEVRAAALRAMVARPRGTRPTAAFILDTARRALQDQDAEVRAAAVAAVAALAGGDGEQVAVAAADDVAGAVRVAAGRAFVDLGQRERGMAILRRELGDEDAAAQAAAAVILAGEGDAEGQSALSRLAADSDATVREAALAGHGEAALLSDALVAGLADDRASLRVVAASSLLVAIK